MQHDDIILELVKHGLTRSEADVCFDLLKKIRITRDEYEEVSNILTADTPRGECISFTTALALLRDKIGTSVTVK